MVQCIWKRNPMYIREKEAELSVSASQKQWILEVSSKADNISNC